MAEIMERMAEQKQGAVQAAERVLCDKLNSLAAALTAAADAADAARGVAATPVLAPAADNNAGGGPPGAAAAVAEDSGSPRAEGGARGRKRIAAEGRQGQLMRVPDATVFESG